MINDHSGTINFTSSQKKKQANSKHHTVPLTVSKNTKNHFCNETVRFRNKFPHKKIHLLHIKITTTLRTGLKTHGKKVAHGQYLPGYCHRVGVVKELCAPPIDQPANVVLRSSVHCNRVAPPVAPPVVAAAIPVDPPSPGRNLTYGQHEQQKNITTKNW
jgi:hypothetical protein